MVTIIARRSKPHLVAPACPTPCETKTLSDMDDHPGNRAYVPLVEFFVRDDDGLGPEDPAAAIEAALGEALVYYYPVAGRMQETAGGKLAVSCNGEGVAFVEADAAVRLEELGTPLLPPYPCVEELLCDAGDAHVVVGKPIVFMQVTRFQCGGFAIGLRINHCIADGFGMIQFLRAVADVARGEAAPAVLPVWERHLLMARAPPSTGYVHRKLMLLLKDPPAAGAGATPPAASVVCRHFLFGPAEISALRGRVAGYDDLGASCTRFELLTAALWRCRVAAWGLADDQRAVLVFAVNVRRRWVRIPPGYYGNALVFHVVEADAGELRGRPLGHAVVLVREAKADTSEEHVRSTADFMASMREMPPATYHEETYMVSDWTRLGEDEVDFGWARRVGGGVAMPPSPLVSFNAKCVNSDGDESVIVTMALPEAVMERFEKEIDKIWSKN
ncbi:hypothetical protein SEVIR_1G016500v4 [Setaria viridis]|uniref:Uncharacterized protein n=2 Tax=Setaria viridis TaxID=4556 RepID=A0A4U6W4H8_SETVI|nr:acyl transferase 1-like [Setaria viridis]TKW36972.1 hypothetical protein SEVIR_1G016500v2 [Setaria viridis]